MDRTELRNLTWPLLHQPMSRRDVARGIAVTYGVTQEAAESVVDELHRDVETCKRHIYSMRMPPSPVPRDVARANAKKEVAPITDGHFEAMWKWADFVIAKCG
jgi:hypothetical protein